MGPGRRRSDQLASATIEPLAASDVIENCESEARPGNPIEATAKDWPAM
jgi:hypothetical protein